MPPGGSSISFRTLTGSESSSRSCPSNSSRSFDTGAARIARAGPKVLEAPRAICATSYIWRTSARSRSCRASQAAICNPPPARFAARLNSTRVHSDAAWLARPRNAITLECVERARSDHVVPPIGLAAARALRNLISCGSWPMAGAHSSCPANGPSQFPSARNARGPRRSHSARLCRHPGTPAGEHPWGRRSM